MPKTGVERALLERIWSGDREAADALVLDTYAPIYASLVRLCGGNRDLASDLTQETFRRAWEAFSQFDGRCRVFTWLYRIAYNAFLNHLRRPLRVVSLEGAAVSPPADLSPSAEQSLLVADSFRRLRAAVLELPETLRYVVTARYWAGLSVRDLAREEGISTVAIRKRLRRALASLEEALERSSS